MNITWTLAIIIGSSCGAFYHLLRGKTFRQLITYLLAGILGFLAGHTIGSMLMPSSPLTLGNLHILEGIVLSFGLLRLAEWLRP